MRKMLLSVIVSFGFFLLIPASTYADAITIVAGNVTASGNPVAGASVVVTCDGNIQNGTTSIAGAYGVEYNPATLCPDGTKATVTASKGSESGSNSGTVNQEGDLPLNVAIIDVSVPELGLFTALGAVVLSTGAFSVIRRHHISGSNN